ncbi:hypothetical protein [Pantoea ananatis]|uniref:hypothetical protein n=1 Tax=Pantoea ananas TaxID=553 RepID=UPI001F0CB297|nr:hypothetical protein [Pantoea ananatis]
MLPRQFCHTGTRLQAQLRYADFELQKPAWAAFFDRQVRFQIEGVKPFLEALWRVFLRQWPVNSRKRLNILCVAECADVQLLCYFLKNMRSPFVVNSVFRRFVIVSGMPGNVSPEMRAI